jgi:hypothetical protein
MKQPLGSPQTYHLNKIQNSTTNETIPEFSTNIYHLNKIQNTTTNETIPGLMIYVCGKPRDCFIFLCVLYFVEMIYVCGKPRDCFICCCVLYFVEMIYVCGKPRDCFISKYKNKRNNSCVFHKHISSEQSTKDKN